MSARRQLIELHTERAEWVMWLAMLHSETFRWALDDDENYVIVYITLPRKDGQVSWRIHVRDWPMFASLRSTQNRVVPQDYWDGHTAEDRKHRLMMWIRDLTRESRERNRNR